MEIIVFLMLSLVLSIFMYKKGNLTLESLALTFIVLSSSYLTGGIIIYVAFLMLFFSPMIFMNLFNEERKLGVSVLLKNSILPLISSIIYLISEDATFIVLTYTFVSVTISDMYSTIFGMASDYVPRNIISGKLVEKGYSGGVSLAGFFGALVGTFLMTLIYFLFHLNSFDAVLFDILGIFFCGLLGSLLDSILGALIQVKYIDHEKKVLTEKKMSGYYENEKYRGISFINGNTIDIITSIIIVSIYVGIRIYFKK